jgi:hypothetical protein
MIQVKNKSNATTPHGVLGGNFLDVSPGSKPQQQTPDPDNDNTLILKNVQGPVLFLLFDLGTEPGSKTEPVRVSLNKTGITIWAIHSRGNDAGIFGCLKRMNCETSSNTFFTSIKLENNTHNTLCQRNKIFSALDRNFRYYHTDTASGPASGPALGTASGPDKGLPTTHLPFRPRGRKG